MVNPVQRHKTEKGQSQNSSGLSGTRVWILNWLKVTEHVVERLGFQLSVQVLGFYLSEKKMGVIVGVWLIGSLFCSNIPVASTLTQN